jgi:ribosomal protein L37AE/L43A
MPRWKLKDCPRCGGDIFMDIDENGWLGHCLQCGYMGRGLTNEPEAVLSEATAVQSANSLEDRELYLAKK